jgi:hypothetical protein
MPDKTDQVATLLTQVVGAVNDVENTLQTSPSHEKKAAAITALQDAVNIAATAAPNSDAPQLKSATSNAIDLVVNLKNVLGMFKRTKHTKAAPHAVPSKKTA